MPGVTAPLVQRQAQRESLRRCFESTIRSNKSLDRSLVSFQGNRRAPFFSWFKYKEAFSAEFASAMVERFAGRRCTVLDPFAGVGTALFAARVLGRGSVGLELLPVGFFVTEARLAAEAVAPTAFRRRVREVAETDWTDHFDAEFLLPHIPITRGAFPDQTEKAVAGFRAFCAKCIRDPDARKLFQLAGLSVLEAVSYTRKDGQYLRWDCRCRGRNIRTRFDKGDIPSFRDAVSRKLQQIAVELSGSEDVVHPLFAQRNGERRRLGAVDLRLGSCLEMLPRIASESFGLVLTSPPYCNRYDYTRTYALELVYLGYDAEQVKTLRQSLLSCTVENHAKDAQLRGLYSSLGATAAFNRVKAVFEGQAALHEVLAILARAGRAGRLNNANIPRMVRNYFFEMAFVIYELARVLKGGGHVVMVNDNVRYNGEEVPVDLILSDFAKAFGLDVECIWTLPRGKGNSSQQMGAHGREELRKCVYVWRKP